MAIEAGELEPVEQDTQQEQPVAFPNITRQFIGRGANSPQAIALHARSIADREAIAAQHFQMQVRQQELEKVKTMADIMKENHRIDNEMEQQRQSMHAINELHKLSPDESANDIISRHPEAMKDPAVADMIKGHQAGQVTREKQFWENWNQQYKETSQLASRLGVDMQFDPKGNPSNELTVKHASDPDVPKKPIAEKPAPAPSLKDLSSKIKAYDPQLKVSDFATDWKKDQTGDTYTKSFKSQPNKQGQTTDIPVTIPAALHDHFRESFKTIVGGQESTAAATSSPTPVPSASPSPAASPSPVASPVIPPDHIAFLRANPDKAESFDAKYGAGASSKILAQ